MPRDHREGKDEETLGETWICEVRSREARDVKLAWTLRLMGAPGPRYTSS